jgi:hypothetical protein
VEGRRPMLTYETSVSFCGLKARMSDHKIAIRPYGL